MGGFSKPLKQGSCCLTTIHRLRWGGHIQFAPPALLEGVIHETDGSDNITDEIFVPQCQKLDKEVRALHKLARNGTLTTDAAERQLNTYLLTAVVRHKTPRNLLLPLPDTPHPGILPDIGHVMHRVMARDPIQCCLSSVIEQCIPSLRHTTRVIAYTDSQDVLMNIIMGMLLGLYQDSTKKPGFRVRALIYAKLHYLLTSTREEQTVFCKKHEAVIILACMEYIARVVPIHMPAQAQMLTHKDCPTAAFYRRIPGLCDELRQSLDENYANIGNNWEFIHEICTSKVSKVSRLKRVATASVHKEIAPWNSSTGFQSDCPSMKATIDGYLAIPQLHTSSLDEFRLLSIGLHLNPLILQQIQTEIQIHPLPKNLLEIQSVSLQELASANQRKAFLRTRRYICAHCLLSQTTKSCPMATLRLDTLMQRLVCATCLKPDLVCINLLGRILSFRKQQYYLCPQCMTVQQYKASEDQIWTSQQGCEHTSQDPRNIPKNGGKKKLVCFWCSEPAAIFSVERVNHLTGEMLWFHYCQRHTPRPDTLTKCSNARQLSATSPQNYKSRITATE
jgi:hypothetical protein